MCAWLSSVVGSLLYRLWSHPINSKHIFSSDRSSGSHSVRVSVILLNSSLKLYHSASDLLCLHSSPQPTSSDRRSLKYFVLFFSWGSIGIIAIGVKVIIAYWCSLFRSHLGTRWFQVIIEWRLIQVSRPPMSSSDWDLTLSWHSPDTHLNLTWPPNLD